MFPLPVSGATNGIQNEENVNFTYSKLSVQMCYPKSSVIGKNCFKSFIFSDSGIGDGVSNADKAYINCYNIIETFSGENLLLFFGPAKVRREVNINRNPNFKCEANFIPIVSIAFKKIREKN